jgi:thiol-disulfide isomerase/thioredoxin
MRRGASVPAAAVRAAGVRAAGVRAAGVLAAVLALTTACTAASPDRPAATAAAVVAAPTPYAECTGLAAPPPEAPGSSGARGDGAPAAVLPAITLPCFSGGGVPVALAGLRGPAVVNLWASWCHPCRSELPVLQRYAERAAGRVHVVGVVTEDPAPERPASLALDLGLTFPSLFDPAGELQAALGRAALPITLFVDGAGTVRAVHLAGALDDAELERQVEQHLGVSLAGGAAAGGR